MSHEELTKESVIRRLLSERAVLLGYVRSLGLDEHLAEDVLQNVCIVVIEKYEQAKNWEHFGAWVRTIARFEAMNAARRQRKTAQLFDERTLDVLDQHWMQYDTAAELQERAALLQRCIERLTPYARKLLRLRYQDGMRGVDLAEAVQRKVQSVYVALSRAHKAVGECVARGLGSDGGASHGG
jgi:RNA polymerase sigma-70 factor (ECF subfamily)